MELRQYGQVLVDRYLVVASTFLIALLVSIVSVLAVSQGPGTFSTVLALSIRPDPVGPSTTPYYSDDYYSYVASEYANDDLISILESGAFIQAVRDRLANEPGGAPDGSIQARKAHRVVEITIASATSAGGLAIGRTIASMLTGSGAQSAYFALFTNRVENVTVVDGPRQLAQPAGRNALLNIAARAVVGLVAGVAVAFLVEYLDDTIRPNDIGTLLGLPIVGDIPGRGVPRRGSNREIRSVRNSRREPGR